MSSMRLLNSRQLLSAVLQRQLTLIKSNSTCISYSTLRSLTSNSLSFATKKTPSPSTPFNTFDRSIQPLGLLNWNQTRGLAKKNKAGKGQKGRKAAAAEEEEDEDEKSDSDDDDEKEGGSDAENDDVKVFHTTVISLRLDAIGKTVFNIPRNKVEESFYNDLIRVNGERVGKKSYEVRVGDELDYIKGLNAEDRSKLDITRVQILSVDDKAASSGRIRFSFRKTNGLTVDNYSRDPYEGAL